MKRRSTSRGKEAKSRRSKAAGAKKRKAPKAVRNRGAAIARQETVVARLTHERDEVLLREIANSEILRLISKSPGDLELVFSTILEHATRICNANFGVLDLYDGDAFRSVAHFNTPTALLEALMRRGPFKPAPGSPFDQVMQTRKVFHSADNAADPVPSLAAKVAGARSLLAVPMLKDNQLLGIIIIYRQEVRPFTDKQIELLQNFASQAVIAIENARLLSELRESLEQQTATSEVLQVISSSRGELQAVFRTMLAKATELCGASYGALWLRVNDGFRFAALHGDLPQIWTDHLRNRTVIRVRPDVPLARLLQTLRPVSIPDMRSDPSYLNGDPLPVSGVDIGGVRTLVVVPMIKDNDLVGAIAIYRKEVNPFAEKQIELLSNFAAQAVIAIENARLLNELRGSLEQQTATSDVLRIIAGSPGELDAVFKTMLKNARHICDAKFGILMLREAEGFRSVAIDGAPDAYTAAMRENPYIPPRPGSGLVVLFETKKPVQIADLQAEPGYAGNRLTTLAGARTLLIVPLLKDDAVLGAINIYRQEVRSFTEQQIALLQNFAAQAVIAIENARLLNELRQRTADLSESLEQQTATSEILRVISSSPSELEPVFQTILEKAVRICDANFGTLFMVEGDKYRTAAGHNMPPAFLEQRRQAPMLSMLGDTALGRVAKTKLPVQIPDAAEDPAYRADPQRRSFISQAGARTLVCVPMLKQEALVGAIGIYRKEVRPFNDKQIALVQNFADQAVIAIENARLLNELRERTHELEARSQEIAKLNLQLEARVADQVGEIERMGRLRRFLPPQVADLIVASGTEKQLESHRREITALFCDLRGFTGFSESSDPEDVMTLLRQYHAAIGEIIIKYSGTLERYAGDGVMVVFNDPVPVDNPALQAVRMALDMRAALGTLIEKWRRLGHELGFGIGIAHGYATLGTIGFEGRFDYAAIGTVSNVASRLCDEAKPGQILISPRVLMAVEDAVTVAPVGDFALKGISRPLAAYNVVEAK